MAQCQGDSLRRCRRIWCAPHIPQLPVRRGTETRAPVHPPAYLVSAPCYAHSKGCHYHNCEIKLRRDRTRDHRQACDTVVVYHCRTALSPTRRSKRQTPSHPPSLHGLHMCVAMWGKGSAAMRRCGVELWTLCPALALVRTPSSSLPATTTQARHGGAPPSAAAWASSVMSSAELPYSVALTEAGKQCGW